MSASVSDFTFLKGARRIAIVSPYSEQVNARAAHYFKTKHGLDTVALEGLGATDAYAIGKLGPQNARDAFARIDRAEIEVFANQASLWAMLRAFDSSDRLEGFGRLLADLPADA